MRVRIEPVFLALAVIAAGGSGCGDRGASAPAQSAPAGGGPVEGPPRGVPPPQEGPLVLKAEEATQEQSRPESNVQSPESGAPPESPDSDSGTQDPSAGIEESPAVADDAPAEAPPEPGPPPPEQPDLEPETEDKERRIQSIPGGGRLYHGQKMVVLNGITLLQRGPIELFACTDGGKDHESIVRLRCQPQSLNLALILLSLKPGPPPGRPGDPPRTQGDRVVVTVEWRTPDGGTRLRRAEEMIRRADRDATMPLVGWVFIGSRFLPEMDLDTGKEIPGRTVFAAARFRSIITTWRDPTSILDNPLPDAEDDSLYVVNGDVMPPPGTKVRVVMRPPTDEERKEIAAVESKLKVGDGAEKAPK